MRQPDPTTVTIDRRALRTLVESVPDNRLRDFALDLLLANTNAPAPAGRMRRSPAPRSAKTRAKRSAAQLRRRAREARERRAAR
jgi:hypothetical protein